MRSLGPTHVLVAVHVLGMALRADPGIRLEFVGGNLDDQAFARAAAGLKPGDVAPEGDFQKVLDAIRATDRFRSVEGGPGRVFLDPWPPLAGIDWRGDAPSALRKTLFPGLHTGDRVGALRLESLRLVGVERMVAAGYPKARIEVARGGDGSRVAFTVASGLPNRVTGVEVVGKTGPYTPEQLVSAAGVVPGVSIWSREFELECMRRLRKKMVSGKRFESSMDLDWDAGGLLRITAQVGPKVFLKYKGSGLGWATRLKDLVPLARADRYSPELLEEGERRIVRRLRSKGYLDPQVSYRREVTRTGPDGPEEVVVTYTLAPGPVSTIGAITFEGNQAVGKEDLKKAAGNGGGFILSAKARPENMDDVENRLEAFYQNKGFTDVKIRRNVTLRGKKADLLFRIREGRQKLVKWVRLDLPSGGFGDPWGLGECLPLLFSDKPVLAEKTPTTRVYRSDRPEMAGLTGDLSQSEAKGVLSLTLTLSKPIPLLKSEFFKVYTAIRQQHLSALGVLRPTVRSQVVEAGDEVGILIEVPDQPTEKVNRLVVRGSDKTRAKAVLREIPLQPGDPVSQEALSGAQGRLGGLGAFQRVEVSSLGDPSPESAPVPETGPPSPWKAGDLLFRLEERSPWVVTHSFGYDKTQGYYLGTDVQRLNVGGMGRTLDFNVRAGDGTINNPTLRNFFKTGEYTNSLDSYSVAYTDPWFDYGKLGEALPDRTTFRTEGAYIQEQRYIYNLHRRRVTSSLRWALGPSVSLETGYRFERVEVAAASGVTNLDSATLANIARYPQRAIISAPYIQVVRDTRDNAFDPTSGIYSMARLDVASQFFLTSANSSFVKLDLRSQWTWPVGYKARDGVVALGLRVGVAKPTAQSAEDLPLSERFFAGGSGSMRGVQPSFLGPLGAIPTFGIGPDGKLTETGSQLIPLGGQSLVLGNLEYRFPLIGQSVWGEVFVDSGQLYQGTFNPWYTNSSGNREYLPIRTALGIGLIFKIGIPLKLEYAEDVNRILGRPVSSDSRFTELKNILISMGFQF